MMESFHVLISTFTTNPRGIAAVRGVTYGDKDFVASAEHFVNISSANQYCCGDNFNCYNNNMNCHHNSYSCNRDK